MPAIIITVNEEGCSCDRCVMMCKTYSCLPTPQEAEVLINAGYGDRMMMDTRPAISDPKLLILTLIPAMKGYERRISPMQTGISDCSFLENDRCTLHNPGMKPLEGKFNRHDTTDEEANQIVHYIKYLWSLSGGRAVVDAWIERYLHEDCK
jgi:hypothetical protein